MTLQPLEEMTDTTEQELSAYPPLLRRLLINRGIVTQHDAYRFLMPSYEDHTFDPFLLRGVKEAVDRIYQAVKNKEHILVYADYDCDGIPGAVVMHDFFAMLSHECVTIYIPDRHKEGYGLQIESLKKIFETQKPDLVITVDLGITNVAEVTWINEQGVEVIVTDHHLPGEILPSAYAVVNPKQDLCQYPDPMLCGTGVAFKLVQAFLQTHRDEFSVGVGQEKWLLDMVGLATLSDMVPLVNENRVFAYFGLTVLKKTRRLGLSGLLKKAGVETSRMTEDDITFSVSPRINAAGRMDHPHHAFRLLSLKDRREAEETIALLERYNTTRKDLVKTIMRSAEQRLSKRTLGPVIVVGDRSWSPGILGLVASRLVEKHNRPVFVWGGGDGGEEHLKGSCRSDGAVHIVNLMEQARESFVTFGGHELAGGFAVSFDAVHFLEERLTHAYGLIEKKPKDLEKIYIYDSELSLDDVTRDTYQLITRLAPFGVGNPKPVFLFRDIEIASVRGFGKHNEHVEFVFSAPSLREIKAIAFFKTYTDFDERIRVGSRISLFASLEESNFGYKNELRLRVVDIHYSDTNR